MKRQPMVMDCRIQIVKMTILSKAIYRFSVITIKIPISFLIEILKKTILKFIWNHNRPEIVKAILSKKNNTGEITILDFKIYYTSIVIKTVHCWL